MPKDPVGQGEQHPGMLQPVRQGRSETPGHSQKPSIRAGQVGAAVPAVAGGKRRGDAPVKVLGVGRELGQVVDSEALFDVGDLVDDAGEAGLAEAPVFFVFKGLA
jgi:hypothetical protein